MTRDFVLLPELVIGRFTGLISEEIIGSEQTNNFGNCGESWRKMSWIGGRNRVPAIVNQKPNSEKEGLLNADVRFIHYT
jgi:hypothetical protein